MKVTTAKWSLTIEKLPCGGFLVTDGYSRNDMTCRQFLFASETLEGCMRYIKAAMTYEEPVKK